MRSTASHPSIIRLLLGCCPPTILWLIVAVIVSPIYGVSNARPLAHVRQKSSEVVLPRSTHTNAAPAVVFVIHAALVIASVLHSLPDVILDSSAFKVSAVRLSNSFQSETSARQNSFPDVVLPNSGGYFSNLIGPLGGLGLIERDRGIVRPTEILFPPGLA